MIDVCMFLVGMLPNGGSLTYNKNYARRAVPRVQACLELADTAKKEGADVHLVLALAARESGFVTGLTSRAGAVSVMGIIPKYCRTASGKKCRTAEDNRQHGIRYITQLTQQYDTCTALAKYNAGNAGACEGVGGAYAEDVIETYEKLCYVFGGERCYAC